MQARCLGVVLVSLAGAAIAGCAQSESDSPQKSGPPKLVSPPPVSEGAAKSDSAATEKPGGAPDGKSAVAAAKATVQAPGATVDAPAGSVTAAPSSRPEPPVADAVKVGPSAETPAASDPPAVVQNEQVPATVEAPAFEQPPNDEPSAETVSLSIGNPAPPLKIASWSKGQPVESFNPGQVYVVEFWATWCGPCRQSMPHMAELQSHYGDKVRFIGVTAEDADTVKTFLDSDQSEGKTWDQVVTYALAIDAGRLTNDAYMEAAGQNGIPTAFVVGSDGMIEWIGHPMAMETPLEQVVAGEWDRVLAKTEFDNEQKVKLVMQEAQQSLIRAVRNDDWDAALAIMDHLLEQFPENFQLKFTKLNLLKQAGRAELAAALADGLIQENWGNAQILNEISWGIATGSLGGSMELALKGARRAAELTEDKSATILDTLARVYFEQGQIDEALNWERKAAEIDGANAAIKNALKEYEAAKAAAGDTPPQGQADPPAAPPAVERPAEAAP